MLINVPKKDIVETEKLENKLENIDIVREFQLEENKELSSSESEKSAIFYLKRAMTVLTASVILMNASPTFAAEKGGQKLTERQKIELKIQELEKQKNQLDRQDMEQKAIERKKELKSYLNYFDIEGLSLGEPKARLRCACEQFGLYLNGNHLGDIRSKSVFSREEFSENVLKVLEKNELRSEIGSKSNPNEAFDAKINISSEAMGILKSWGGKIEGNIINIGSTREKLELDKKTKSVNISSSVFSSGESILYIAVEDIDGAKTIVICKDKKISSIKEFNK